MSQSNTVRTYTKGNQILRIIQDTDPESPRGDDADNPNTMVCFHNSYDLGDKHDFENPDSFKDFMNENPGIVSLPIYLYDHSGLRMSTTSFDCRWDSGQIGYIYCTEKQLQDEWNGDKEKAKAFLLCNITTYDQFLMGDIYGFELVETSVCDHDHTHENDLDSCWGFYGSDPTENGMIENMSFDSLNDWELKE